MQRAGSPDVRFAPKADMRDGPGLRYAGARVVDEKLDGISLLLNTTNACPGW
jgi:hypothetical protein